MLLLQAVLDAYLCLVHLTLGIMIESLFHSFGTVAFMQFGELDAVRYESFCALCGLAKQLRRRQLHSCGMHHAVM